MQATQGREKEEEKTKIKVSIIESLEAALMPSKSEVTLTIRRLTNEDNNFELNPIVINFVA